ncbi:MAG: hypothetical protein Q8Q52_01770 [Acidimicrobiia bacterium]|nr:hypothetical protein [Acidimicrobiia bacterium]
MTGSTVAIHVPQLGDRGGKHWAKVVTAVDTNKTSGWAFTGEFVADGGIQDLPAGAVLLLYGERGSRANPQQEARLYRVNSDATLTPHGEAQGRAWARTLRDRAVELLNEQPIDSWLSSPDLAGWSDRQLADELTRRGWQVAPPD